MADQIININTIDAYNKTFGIETRHPLVSIAEMAKARPTVDLSTTITYHYGVYAIFLKQALCGDITYGRQPYDYQEGTVTSFAPGQVVTIKPHLNVQPDAIGLLFHPDLIKGTSLGKDIKQYRFFSYSSREALHLNEDEKEIFKDCILKIQQELEHPIDSHSRRLICRNIELLLDYCLRFYERQFITRKAANKDVLERFEELLNTYFENTDSDAKGLPTVKYFAERCFLSPNYFGDLIKKETGMTPQEHIQAKIIDLAKEELLGTEKTISEIAYQLGFQYSQHFNRYFKRNVGMSPSQYRKS
ncbi:AraC family transcriptional regulator [Prevotella sp. KH2C16]|uniref:helix-turn-helix domain-containing protein n=1 Tax=Prevotella sp. KH2C16 TaxID=1855325 RepID=UPI0008F31D85|nr:helix-turn-helix domain-containing protein [Prevotella sp. KH2C16]SFG64277.1 Helix-turn-helix domain-containing protein [Prevotella sp. KH2C16]